MNSGRRSSDWKAPQNLPKACELQVRISEMVMDIAQIGLGSAISQCANSSGTGQEAITFAVAPPNPRKLVSWPCP